MSSHSASAPRPMAPSNRILEAGWAAQQHAAHQARLAAMKPLVNSRPPATAKIKLNREKQRAAHEADLLRIDRENRILLERMSHIQSKPNPDYAFASPGGVGASSSSHGGGGLSSSASTGSLKSPSKKSSLNAFIRMQERERILEENAALVARLKKGRGYIDPAEFHRHEVDYGKLKEAASIARAAPAPLPPKVTPPVGHTVHGGSSSDRSLNLSASTSSLGRARPRSSAPEGGLATSASAKSIGAAVMTPSPSSTKTLTPLRSSQAGRASFTGGAKSPVKIVRTLAETRDARGPVQLIFADTYPAHRHASSHAVQLATDGRRLIDGRQVMVTVEEVASIVVHTAPAKPSAHASSPAFKPLSPSKATSTSSPAMRAYRMGLLGAEGGSVAPSPFLSATPSPLDHAKSPPAPSKHLSINGGGGGLNEQDLAHSFVFRTFDHARLTHDFVSVPWVILSELPEAADLTKETAASASSSPKKHPIDHQSSSSSSATSSASSKQAFAVRMLDRLRFHDQRLGFNPSHALGQAPSDADHASASDAASLLGKSASSGVLTTKAGSTWDQIGSDGALHRDGMESPDLERSPRSAHAAADVPAPGSRKSKTPHHLTQTTAMLVRAGVSASTVERNVRLKQERLARKKDFESHRLKDLTLVTRGARERSRSRSPGKTAAPSQAVPKGAAALAAALAAMSTGKGKPDILPDLALHEEKEQR